HRAADRAPAADQPAAGVRGRRALRRHRRGDVPGRGLRRADPAAAAGLREPGRGRGADGAAGRPVADAGPGPGQLLRRPDRAEPLLAAGHHVRRQLRRPRGGGPGEGPAVRPALPAARDGRRAAADAARDRKAADAPAARGVTFAAFGLAGFDWPRAEVVGRTTTRVARSVLRRWVVPDLKRAREVVPQWAADRWTQFGLDPDTLLGHMQAAAELAVGGK